MIATVTPAPTTFPPFQRDHQAEADELKSLRETLGWTQETTARMLGVSQKTYNRWEKRAEPCQWAALELMRSWVRDNNKTPKRKQ